MAAQRTVREFISEFRGLSGTAKQAAVLARSASPGALATYAPAANSTRPRLQHCWRRCRRHQTGKAEPFGLIGKDHLRSAWPPPALEMETFDYSRNSMSPMTACPAWSSSRSVGAPKPSSRQLITGVNWSPGITNPFRQLGSYGRSLDTVLSQQRADPTNRSILVLHVACPRVEYTDRGKSAIAIAGEDQAGGGRRMNFHNAIIRAVTKGTEKWAKQRKAEERHASAVYNRRERLIRYRRVTIKDAAWAVMEQAYMAASGNGTLPAPPDRSCMQARPTSSNRPASSSTTSISRNAAARLHGGARSSVGCCFDDRGHFTEPHTESTYRSRDDRGQKISGLDRPDRNGTSRFKLGGCTTCGPERRFGAILFIEKEGFLPLFEHVQLAERYDIALHEH